MRLRIVSLAAAFSWLSAFPSSADILTLKDGKKIEGTILSEDGDKYVIEVKVTATIRDERIIPRAEVLKVEKASAYEKAFVEIANFFPTPELLSIEGYEERIKKLKDFNTAHPDSPKRKDVESMVKSLEEEMALIQGGAIKLGEEIIASEEYEANAYHYDAFIAEKKIRDAVSRRDLLGALRGFDSYEMSFGATEGYPALVSLITQVLGAYNANITQSLASFDSRLATRNSGLIRMAANDREKSQRALETEQTQLLKRLEEELSAKMKWITPHAFLKQSLEEAKKQVATELTRLEKAEVGSDVPLTELYREAWMKLKDSIDDVAKQAILTDAKAKGMPEAYVEKLTKHARIGENLEEPTATEKPEA